MSGQLPEDWAADLPQWKPRISPSRPASAGGVVNALAKRIPNIIGGSADLNPSTNTALRAGVIFSLPKSGGPGTLGAVGGVWSYAGRMWRSEFANMPWARQ